MTRKECTCGAAEANAQAYREFLTVQDDLRASSVRVARNWQFQIEQAQARGVIPAVIGMLPGCPVDTEACEDCFGTGYGCDEAAQMTGEPCRTCDGYGAIFIYEDEKK